MNGKPRKIAATFLFAAAALTCSLIVAATPPGQVPTPAPHIACPFRVLIVYADYRGREPSAIRAEIAADPQVTGVDLFNASTGTPSDMDLLQYDLVLAMSNGPFHNATLLGDNLADYVDGGGVVVQASLTFLGPAAAGGINGRWITGNYSPFAYSNDAESSQFTSYIWDQEHPLMARVNTLNFSFLQKMALAPGATRLASALPGGSNLVAYQPVAGGHTTVGIAAYLGFADDHSGDWGMLIVNAARWLRPCTTPTPTATPTATSPPGATPTPTATATATASATPVATPTATATATPLATATATATGTASPFSSPRPTPTATPTFSSHLANISTRIRVEAGDNVLIAGFIVEGTSDKRLVIRGLGPSLAPYGVEDPLEDPTLQLFS